MKKAGRTSHLCFQIRGRGCMYDSYLSKPILGVGRKRLFCTKLRVSRSLFSSLSIIFLFLSLPQLSTVVLKPNTVTGIIGGPGSGKTLLLRALSGVGSFGRKVCGVVESDGPRFFVPADELSLIPGVTGREMLEGIVGAEDDVVEGVASKMRLLDALDTVTERMSGGERRRLVLGMGIVRYLSQKRQGGGLFLDESLSGLDVDTGEVIMEYLRELASTHHCVILLSLLQPPPELYASLHNILLLSSSYLLFHGPHSSLDAFLESSCSSPLPSTSDAADSLALFTRLPSLCIPAAPSPQRIAKKWEEWRVEGGDVGSVGSVGSRRVEEDGMWGRVLWREAVGLYRGWKRLVIDIAVVLLVWLVVGLLYLDRVRRDVDDDDGSANTVGGLLMMYCVQSSLNNLLVVPQEAIRRIARVRSASSSSTPLLAALSQTVAMELVQFPYLLVIEVLRSIAYVMSGMSMSSYGVFLAVMMLLDVTTGRVFRFLTLLLPWPGVSHTIGGSLVGLWTLFGGFFVSRSTMPRYLRPFMRFSPIYWAWSALVRSEYSSDRYDSKVAPPFPLTRRQLYKDQLGLPNHQSSQEALEMTFLVFGITYAITILLTPIAVLRIDDYSRGSTTTSTSHPIASKTLQLPTPSPSSFAITTSIRPTVRCSMHFSKVAAKTSSKVLLDNVWGSVSPGRMLAILGATGSGKSTLLDVLAKRQDGSLVTSGAVQVDGGGRVMYMPQKDVLFPTITATEAVEMASWLSQSQVDVSQVLELMRLSHVSDVMVEDMSAGERKRLALATHLTSKHPVLVCDEPTTNLDALEAAEAVVALRTAADSGFAVAAAIHIPSAVCFAAFDDLLLLHKGRQVYFGSIKDFPATISSPLPPRLNPATFALRQAQTLPPFHQPEEDDEDEVDDKPSEEEARLSARSPSIHSPPAPGLESFLRLLRRAWQDSYRNRGLLVARGISVPCVALAFALVFNGLADSLDEISSLTSLLGAMVGLPGFVGVLTMGTLLPSLAQRRPALEVEASSGLLLPCLPSLATLIVEWFATTCITTTILLPFLASSNFLTTLSSATTSLIWTDLCLVGLWYTANAFLFLFSTPSLTGAFVFFGMFSGPVNILAGLYLHFNKWPDYFLWIADASPMALSIRAITLLILQGNDSIELGNGREIASEEWAEEFSTVTFHSVPRLVASIAGITILVACIAISFASLYRPNSKW